MSSASARSCSRSSIRSPPHRGLSGRVGAVSTRGAELRTYETMELSADSGPAMTIYTADAGSASERALDHLAGVADHAGRH